MERIADPTEAENAVPEPVDGAADRVAAPASEDDAAFVLLRAGSRFYGLPIGAIREIVKPRPYTVLPGSAACVRGMINVRGRIITVVDLAAALTGDLAPVGAQHRVLIVEYRRRSIGLAADEVLQIVRVDPREIDRSQDTLAPLGLAPPLVRGVARFGAEPFVIVDPEEVLQPILP